jgi:transposase InsO family protein
MTSEEPESGAAVFRPWARRSRASSSTSAAVRSMTAAPAPDRRRRRPGWPAGSRIGLYKTELIKPRGPWRTAGQVELATLNYVDWYNHRRLFETCGDIPPAELETAYYRQNTSLAEGG